MFEINVTDVACNHSLSGMSGMRATAERPLDLWSQKHSSLTLIS